MCHRVATRVLRYQNVRYWATVNGIVYVVLSVVAPLMPAGFDVDRAVWGWAFCYSALEPPCSVSADL